MTFFHKDQHIVWKDRLYIKFLLSHQLFPVSSVLLKNKKINSIFLKLFSYFLNGEKIDRLNKFDNSNLFKRSIIKRKKTSNELSLRQRLFFKKKGYSAIQLYQLLKQQLYLLNSQTIKQHRSLFKRYSISLIRPNIKEEINFLYEDDIQLLNKKRRTSNVRFRFSRLFLRVISSYVLQYNRIVNTYKLYVLSIMKHKFSNNHSIMSYRELLMLINKLFIRIKKKANITVRKSTRLKFLYPFFINSSPFLYYQIKCFLLQRCVSYLNCSYLNTVQDHFNLMSGKRKTVRDTFFLNNVVRQSFFYDLYVPFFRFKYVTLSCSELLPSLIKSNYRSLYSFILHHRRDFVKCMLFESAASCQGINSTNNSVKDLCIKQVSFLSTESCIAHHFFSYLSTFLPKIKYNMNVVDYKWKKKEKSFLSGYPMFLSKNQFARYRRRLNVMHFSYKRSNIIRLKKKRTIRRYRTLFLCLNVRNSNIFITLRTKKKVILTRWSGLLGFKKRLKVQKNAAYKLAYPFIKYIINRSKKYRMKRLVISVKGYSRFFHLYYKPFRNMIRRRLKLMKRQIRQLRMFAKQMQMNNLKSLHNIKPYLIEGLVYKWSKTKKVNTLIDQSNISYMFYNDVKHYVNQLNVYPNEELKKIDSLTSNLMSFLECACPHLLKIISTYIIYTQLAKPSWSKKMVNTYLNQPLLSYQYQILNTKNLLIKDVASFFYCSLKRTYMFLLSNKQVTSSCLIRYYQYYKMLIFMKFKFDDAFSALIHHFRSFVIEDVHKHLTYVDHSFQRKKVGPFELYSIEKKQHYSDIFNIQRMINNQKKIESTIRTQMRRRYLYMKLIHKLSFYASRSHGGCPKKYKLYDRYYYVFDKDNENTKRIRLK